MSAASRNPSLSLVLTGHVLSPEALFLHCLGLSVCVFHSAHVSNYLIFFPVLSFGSRQWVVSLLLPVDSLAQAIIGSIAPSSNLLPHSREQNSNKGMFSRRSSVGGEGLSYRGHGFEPQVGHRSLENLKFPSDL